MKFHSHYRFPYRVPELYIALCLSVFLPLTLFLSLIQVPLPIELPDLPLMPLSYQSANITTAPAVEGEKYLSDQ